MLHVIGNETRIDPSLALIFGFPGLSIGFFAEFDVNRTEISTNVGSFMCFFLYNYRKSHENTDNSPKADRTCIEAPTLEIKSLSIRQQISQSQREKTAKCLMGLGTAVNSNENFTLDRSEER